MSNTNMTCAQLPTMLPPTLPALHFELFSQWYISKRRENIAACLFRAIHVSHKISAGDRVVCLNIVHGHRTNFFMSWPRLALCSCFCTPRRSSVVSVMLILNASFSAPAPSTQSPLFAWPFLLVGVFPVLGLSGFCCTLRTSCVLSVVLTFKGIT